MLVIDLIIIIGAMLLLPAMYVVYKLDSNIDVDTTHNNFQIRKAKAQLCQLA